MTASGRTLSRLARVTARGQAGDTWLLPACERWSQDGWPDVKPRRVLRRLPLGLLWFLKRRRLSLLLQEGRFLPRFRLICRILPGVFEPVRILFPVAIGGIAGMTASAAGSRGAVCPSTAAGGAVIFFFVYGCAGYWVWVLLCPSTSAAGAVTVGAATAMLAGAGVRLLPLRCMVCLVCLACLALPGVPGPMHCQVTFLSSGCRRRSASGGFDWRDVARVAVPFACGLFSSVGRFYRSSSVRGSGPGVSSTRFWSLLHWRRLSVVLPAALVDCCLASLRAGVCSPPWRWRISTRVLMVAGFPLLRGRRSAPSHIP